jgi:hypothetical protein
MFFKRFRLLRSPPKANVMIAGTIFHPAESDNFAPLSPRLTTAIRSVLPKKGFSLTDASCRISHGSTTGLIPAQAAYPGAASR